MDTQSRLKMNFTPTGKLRSYWLSSTYARRVWSRDSRINSHLATTNSRKPATTSTALITCKATDVWKATVVAQSRPCHEKLAMALATRRTLASGSG